MEEKGKNEMYPIFGRKVKESAAPWAMAGRSSRSQRANEKRQHEVLAFIVTSAFLLPHDPHFDDADNSSLQFHLYIVDPQ